MQIIKYTKQTEPNIVTVLSRIHQGKHSSSHETLDGVYV